MIWSFKILIIQVAQVNLALPINSLTTVDLVDIITMPIELRIYILLQIEYKKGEY